MPKGQDFDFAEWCVRMEEKVDGLVVRVKKVEDFVKEVNANTRSVNDKFEGLKKWAEEVDGKIATLQVSVSSLKAEKLWTEKEVKALRAQLEDLTYAEHANVLEIAGIPVLEVDDVQGIFTRIVPLVMPEIKAGDVISVSRITSKKCPLNMLKVMFKDRDICKKFVEKARKVKLKGDQIGFQERKDRIYFNQYLTPYMRTVFFNARIFKREKGWRYIWQRDGRIFLRRQENDPHVRITCVEDLAVLQS